MQARWEKNQIFKAVEDTSRPKFYCLSMFPYPSGKLHMGHVRNYTIGDVLSRYKALNGFNVLQPMGWDAFGMPAENAAMKHNVAPAAWTYENIAYMKQQLKSLGFAIDWDREVTTCKPDYYRWEQWLFTRLFQKGLIYKKNGVVNWDPVDQTVLANEQVIDGRGWRSGALVEKRDIPMYYFRITAYADELLADLDTLDWPPQVVTMQKNWIGRSEGAQFGFEIPSIGKSVDVYTTRVDTIFGVSYIVLAPEHPYVEELIKDAPNKAELDAFIYKVRNLSEIDRTSTDVEKEGLFTGAYAKNPATGEDVPVWIANYVLVDYGTGAVMGVPAHDERDYKFAKKYNLPLKWVIQNEAQDLDFTAMTDAYHEDGVLVNSGDYTGMKSAEARDALCKAFEMKGIGGKKVNFRLRDWLISRQRYWGEPIPIVHCPKCGMVPVPEDQLPLELPMVESYTPTDTGKSPLANIPEWYETTCPECGGPAERETDTMPQWAGSSWYFLRYFDNKNDEAFASPEKLKYWMPVDWYNGGMEHTTLHLLYSRFWHKFLYDIGQVPTAEPYAKRTSHGMILGENGEKMSKSRGNVVNPDDVVNEFGADTLRLYEMFIGDFEKAAPWSNAGIKGCRRFIERYWNLQSILVDGEAIRPEMENSFHKAIKKVSYDIENLKFNTAIAALMALMNVIAEKGSINKAELSVFTMLLNPFAPHVTEEVWSEMKLGEGMVTEQIWPKYDESKCKDDVIEIVVQVNGKVRARLCVAADIQKDDAIALAKAEDRIAAEINGKNVVKEIYVPGKLVNIVVKG